MRSGYLDQLVVAPDHWGSPLATALVDEAKRLSPDGVTLKVNADNARAIRFYERNGFVHAGEDVNPTSERLVLKMAWKGVDRRHCTASVAAEVVVPAQAETRIRRGFACIRFTGQLWNASGQPGTDAESDDSGPHTPSNCSRASRA